MGIEEYRELAQSFSDEKIQQELNAIQRTYVNSPEYSSELRKKIDIILALQNGKNKS